ncbi:glycoside hydrolase family 16 protein [Rhodanobacter sp. MP1X3]|uniref:glycoside hydrolase family 16 protein n=1 Tax=Rhodanobacter sp. MP1X3 TaxID=2723086 RepID=UPI0016149503|nr:glycoside hydrolase family 16 protein [Rhodanobacter sp. MP1X3]MBB6244936.1 beta-glucanase (GH16 family) [Rhodanobacter sp. MP1X3]
MKSLKLLRRALLAAFCFAAGAMLGIPSFAQQAKLKKLTWGNPDQPWGVRRPVTEADRKAVAFYRSGKIQPVYATNFNDSQKLADDWQFQSEDTSNMKSCRRPENVIAAPGGLQLRTRVATNCKAKWSTGFIISKQHYKFGYFEAEIKPADIDGLNNAFWLVTKDHFEIDIAELHFPNINRMTLHNNNNWATEKDDKAHAVGFDSRFSEDFFRSYHILGVLWTPSDVVYVVDGEPVAAIRTGNSIHAATDIRFSTALMDYAGKIPDHPEGHHMYVKSLRVLPLQ